MSDNASNISVIVPLLNEHENLPKLYERLRLFSFGQLIFVDGGSEDGSWEWLEKTVKATENQSSLIAIQTKPGRASQMNAGAKLAQHPYLAFVHADTYLCDAAENEIIVGLKHYSWGRFDIDFIESDFRMKVVAWFMNKRSRITSIATGDQVLFVRREVFERMAGFTEMALMEDVDFCKRILPISKPYCSRMKVKTSARRWLKQGVFSTIFMMWRFRFLYFFGVSPEKLAAQYRNVR